MKAFVDKDLCIGCGNCEAICPSVFKLGDDGKSEVITEELTGTSIECAKEAEAGCPVEAIKVE